MPAQPLVPQTVPVLFSKLDLKTAPRLAVQGNFVEFINGQMTQTGRVQKRPGYERISSGPAGLSVRHMVTLGEELVVQDSRQIYSYDASTQALVAKGAWSNVQPTMEMVVSNATSQSSPDVAIGSGLEFYVWEDTRSSGQIRYSVRNTATGQYVVTDALIHGSSAFVVAPKVVFTNGRFVVFYSDGAGALKARTVLASSPATVSSATSIATDVVNNIWDVTIRGNNEILLAFQNNSPVALSIWTINATTLAVMTANNDGAISVTGLGWLEHDFSDSQMYLAGTNSVPTTSLLTINAVNVVTSTTVVETAVAQATQLTGVVDTTTSPSTKYVVFQRAGAGSKTLRDTVGLGVVTGGVSTFTPIRSAGIVSRAFKYNNLPHVVLAYEGGQNTTDALTIQQSYFLARLNADGSTEILSRFLTRLGTGMRSRSSFLAGAKALSATEVITSVLQKVQVATESGISVLVKSVARAFLDFADTSLSPPRPAGQGLVIPGGFPRLYDGNIVTELGFHVYPEQPTGITAVATAGALTGNYRYIYVYAWFDRYGNLHRSSPSQASAIVNVNGAPNHSTTHTIDTLRLTNKSNVIIEVYRQNPGGDTNYYKVTSTVSPLFNVSTSDTVSFTDSLSDAEVVRRELLPTTGGVLPNDAPPACRVVGVYKDRVVLASQDLPNRIWLSKPIVSGQGISFTGEFEIELDPVDGEVTAASQLDDKAIFFHENAISFLGGDGPDAANRGGDFSTPVRLAGYLGTTAAQSVARTQDGLLFQSTHNGGLSLLDRGLQTSYRGADVEGYNAQDVVGVVVLPDLEQTRYVSSSGSMLVRDDFHQRWYVWTNYAAASACSYQNLFTWVTANGTIYQETPGAYLDNGTPIRTRLTLAWISPFGLGGQGRLWGVHLIGDYRGTHTLQLGIRYDHADGIVWETLRGDADAIAAGTVYGSGTYGSGTYGGSVAGDLRFEAKPRRQRGSAFQFILEDTIANAVDSAGLDLSALVMLVGAQPGKLAQMSASRTMTSS